MSRRITAPPAHSSRSRSAVGRSHHRRRPRFGSGSGAGATFSANSSSSSEDTGDSDTTHPLTARLTPLSDGLVTVIERLVFRKETMLWGKDRKAIAGTHPRFEDARLAAIEKALLQ
jgi:hypothetical protein